MVYRFELNRPEGLRFGVRGNVRNRLGFHPPSIAVYGNLLKLVSYRQPAMNSDVASSAFV
jgi:hypothetical protein